MLDELLYSRGSFSLRATGTFKKGLHLISGPVGSGKSTLAQLIIGLLPPQQGTVCLPEKAQSTLSFQFPEHHITGWTVGEEIESWGLVYETVCEGHENFPPSKTLVNSLSRGEMKRLHLACLLAKDWDVLILDEPFASLDCQEKTRLCRRLESLQETTVVLIFTHEQVHLPRVSYLWEMDNGILSCCGPVPEGIYSWRKAPFHIKCALSRQVLPKNITVSDALEALCRIPDWDWRQHSCSPALLLHRFRVLLWCLSGGWYFQSEPNLYREESRASFWP